MIPSHYGGTKQHDSVRLSWNHVNLSVATTNVTMFIMLAHVHPPSCSIYIHRACGEHLVTHWLEAGSAVASEYKIPSFGEKQLILMFRE